jgi:hypothetical protein
MQYLTEQPNTCCIESSFQVQVPVFLIPFQDAFTLQKPGNPVADRMHQCHQFQLIRCIGLCVFSSASRLLDQVGRYGKVWLEVVLN